MGACVCVWVLVWFVFVCVRGSCLRACVCVLCVCVCVLVLARCLCVGECVGVFGCVCVGACVVQV